MKWHLAIFFVLSFLMGLQARYDDIPLYAEWEVSFMTGLGQHDGSFLEDSAYSNRTKFKMDSDLENDEPDSNYAISVFFATWDWAIWAEGQRWKAESTVDFGSGGQTLGDINFTGNTSISSDLEVWQGIFYVPALGGHIGLGGTGVRQELAFEQENVSSEYYLGVKMASLRGRWVWELSEALYARVEAQGMLGDDSAQGYDGLAEIGWLTEVWEVNYTNYYQLALGWRSFHVQGSPGQGDLDVTLQGPYARFDFAMRF